MGKIDGYENMSKEVKEELKKYLKNLCDPKNPKKKS